MERRLLLTSVTGPYGLGSGEFGSLADGLKVHLTYGQGVHSPQGTQAWYGLHMLALNISVPTTVLEYPSWNAFCRELRRGYTHVGISFIHSTLNKARQMAEFIRANFPEVKIILGGHGTIIPSIEELVPNDEVCRGEGIGWLRSYFGEDPDRPIVYPLMPYYDGLRVYGINIGKRLKSALIMCGLGCKGGCPFCGPTHHFGYRNYVPFLRTGRQFMTLCRKAEEELGAESYYILDDNFLKNSPMAKEVLPLMEAEGKAYRFTLYASADVVAAIGVDFLVRFGVEQVWIGVESSTREFSKNRAVDVAALVRELQSKGITVVTSLILFLPHHDEETIKQDIDWAISLNSEIGQFTIYTPWPGTCAYDECAAKGLLYSPPDYGRMHGMALTFAHPHFSVAQAHEIQLNAYRRKYALTGPSTLSKAETMVRGYVQALKDCERREREGLVWNHEERRYIRENGGQPDAFMKLRLAEMRSRALRAWPVLLTCRVFSPNAAIRQKAVEVAKAYEEAFGKISWKDRIISWGVVSFATLEAFKIRMNKLLFKTDIIRYQPPTMRVSYNGALAKNKRKAPVRGFQVVEE